MELCISRVHFSAKMGEQVARHNWGSCQAILTSSTEELSQRVSERAVYSFIHRCSHMQIIELSRVSERLDR